MQTLASSAFAVFNSPHGFKSIIMIPPILPNSICLFDGLCQYQFIVIVRILKHPQVVFFAGEILLRYYFHPNSGTIITGNIERRLAAIFHAA
jgi:hypothetical protein